MRGFQPGKTSWPVSVGLSYGKFLPARRSVQSPERCSHLRRQQFRLFPSREVASFVDPIVVDQFGIRPLRPASRRFILLARKDGNGHGDLDALRVEETALVF